MLINYKYKFQVNNVSTIWTLGERTASIGCSFLKYKMETFSFIIKCRFIKPGLWKFSGCRKCNRIPKWTSRTHNISSLLSDGFVWESLSISRYCCWQQKVTTDSSAISDFINIKAGNFWLAPSPPRMRDSNQSSSTLRFKGTLGHSATLRSPWDAAVDGAVVLVI